jgi:hypothetical protein
MIVEIIALLSSLAVLVAALWHWMFGVHARKIKTLTEQTEELQRGSAAIEERFVELADFKDGARDLRTALRTIKSLSKNFDDMGSAINNVHTSVSHLAASQESVAGWMKKFDSILSKDVLRLLKQSDAAQEANTYLESQVEATLALVEKNRTFTHADFDSLRAQVQAWGEDVIQKFKGVEVNLASVADASGKIYHSNKRNEEMLKKNPGAIIKAVSESIGRNAMSTAADIKGLSDLFVQVTNRFGGIADLRVYLNRKFEENQKQVLADVDGHTSAIEKNIIARVHTWGEELQERSIALCDQISKSTESVEGLIVKLDRANDVCHTQTHEVCDHISEMCAGVDKDVDDLGIVLKRRHDKTLEECEQINEPSSIIGLLTPDHISAPSYSTSPIRLKA